MVCRGPSVRKCSPAALATIATDTIKIDRSLTSMAGGRD